MNHLRTLSPVLSDRPLQSHLKANITIQHVPQLLHKRQLMPELSLKQAFRLQLQNHRPVSRFYDRRKGTKVQFSSSPSGEKRPYISGATPILKGIIRVTNGEHVAVSVQALPRALTLGDVYDRVQMADAWCICNYELMANCILGWTIALSQLWWRPVRLQSTQLRPLLTHDESECCLYCESMLALV